MHKPVGLLDAKQPALITEICPCEIRDPFVGRVWHPRIVERCVRLCTAGKIDPMATRSTASGSRQLVEPPRQFFVSRSSVQNDSSSFLVCQAARLQTQLGSTLSICVRSVSTLIHVAKVRVREASWRPKLGGHKASRLTHFLTHTQKEDRLSF